MAQDEDDPTLVSLKGRRHVKCWWCKKEGWQERTFEVRLTPFMRTADGRRHTRETIKVDILEPREAAWKKTNYLHPKTCRDEFDEAVLAVIDQLDAESERWRQVETALLEASNDPAVRALMKRIGLGIEDEAA